MGGAAAWPLRVLAQQPTMPVIGFVGNVPRENYANLMPAFSHGLSEAGFVEGQNVLFDYRWTNNERDLPALAVEMVTRNPSLILGVGGTASALALKNATTTVPIIFIIGADPVNPENPNTEYDKKDVSTAAEALGHKLIVFTAKSEIELNPAIASATAQQVAAMLVASDLFFLGRRTQIVALLARYSLPTMYDRPEYVLAGGLMRDPAICQFSRPQSSIWSLTSRSPRDSAWKFRRRCSPAPTK
jgi:putative ABC transport system substrate-binding protein